MSELKSGVYHPRLTLSPGFQSSRFVTTFYGTSGKVFSNLRYSQLTKLVASASLGNGAKFVLWGEA